MNRFICLIKQHLQMQSETKWYVMIWRIFFRAPKENAPDTLWLYVCFLPFFFRFQLGLEEKNRVDAKFFLALFWRFPSPEQNIQPPAFVKGWLNMELLAVVEKILWPLIFIRRCYDWLIARLPKFNYEKIGRSLSSVEQFFERYPQVFLLTTLVTLPIVLPLIVTTPFSLFEQTLFFTATWWIALRIRRIPGRLPILVLIGLSILVAARYIWWRTTHTLDLETPIEKFLGLLLYAAECYTWLILLFGFVQTAWPLYRKPVPLPKETDLWPSVDIYIPTYNEPLSVVRPTVYAACGIDWPNEKLKIYILDDGRREEFKLFAEQAGVEYIIRPDNFHAKAGNINHALKKTQGEYITIFDCDHIPTRSFLQTTMGWFLKDKKCAMLQTPHHFFSPDPFERNFSTFRQVPNEGSLFYGLVQDGNDLWNATFFCGSCAVIKRQPLLEVGGIAVETVTEDAHTALKMHRRGYTTAYLKLVQAAGLATESLSGHIGQRIRWARGMAQIFRTDNPFLGKGLSFMQRLCYSNAMLHFFYGIPRLIFLTMPLSYLYFELHVINAAALSLAAYVLPHIMHANLANSTMQGKYRHSFWAEVYESVLAWYIVLPTTIAFINPKLGKFNVTAKGGLIEKSYFDWNISKPYLILLFLNLLGFAIGVGRLLFWNQHELSTVLLNMVWTGFNLIMLGAAVGVATEARQIRLSHRVPMRIPAVLYLPQGYTMACYTDNYSSGGVGLVLPEETPYLRMKDRIHIGLNRGDREFCFPGEIVMLKGKQIGVRFEGLSTEQEKNLVQCTFGRADAWLAWDEGQPVDKPLAALFEVFRMGWRGYGRLFRHVKEIGSAWFKK